MARKLRIAASVFFALVMVAMAAIWVRSYSYTDSIVLAHAPYRCTVVDSMLGKLYLGFYGGTTRFMISSASWQGIAVFDSSTSTLVMPHWCLAIASASLGVLLMWPKRFSLRTLLIATTLVAVVLGLGVWAAG